MRQMREAQLSEPVSKWLESLGYQVFVEVPMFEYRLIDMIGLCENAKGGKRIIAVELKTCLTWQVMKQASLNQLFCHESYCAVGTRPRKTGFERCLEWGLGVIEIAYGCVSVVTSPQPIGLPPGKKGIPPNEHWQNMCLEQLRRMTPGGTAGMPTLAGDGPAQEVARRIDAYRAEHPQATWREIFESIPHHYSSARSLQSSMRQLRDRLWHREQQKKEDIR